MPTVVWAIATTHRLAAFIVASGERGSCSCSKESDECKHPDNAAHG